SQRRGAGRVAAYHLGGRAGRDEPAAANTGDGGEGEPIGRRLQRDTASRAEADGAEDGAVPLQRRNSAGGDGGEEFEAGEAEIEGAHDVARGRDAGEEGDRCVSRSFAEAP